MLVLSRMIGEKIMIGDNICITLLDVRADRARIGVEADRDIPVHREEVYDAIQRAQQRVLDQTARISDRRSIHPELGKKRHRVTYIPELDIHRGEPQAGPESSDPGQKQEQGQPERVDGRHDPVEEHHAQ